MQLLIEIPDELARQLESEREHLGDIIARGMRRSWSGNSALRKEIISFLAQRPTVSEILDFRPSEAQSDRAQYLLDKNREGSFSEGEEAELDEICDVDRFFTLLKAQVLVAQKRSE